MLRGVNIGLMDVRVRIQAPVTSRNSINEEVNSFNTLATCFVERLRKPGNERFEGRQQVAISLAEYRGRNSALANVTPKCRLTEDYALADNAARWYYITDVQHYRREGYTILTAELRDNG